MNVVLDTNILIRDYFMESRDIALLLDYVEKTGSRILLPQIVLRELGERFRCELSGKVRAYNRATGFLRRALADVQMPSIEPDITAEVDRYMHIMMKKLNIRDRDIIPLRPEHLDELVTRATRRQKPFSDKGQGFRDALLWLALLDIARESSEEMLAFVSDDAGAFGPGNQLHQALADEAEATGRQIRFFNSLAEFSRSHATQIEYVTRSWLSDVIRFSTREETVVQELREYVQHLNQYDLERRGWQDREFTGRISPTGAVSEENLTEFYVYERADGALNIQANYYFECEVEFTERVRLERFVRRPTAMCSFDRDCDPDDLYDFDDHDYISERRAVYEYPEAEVVFWVTVEAGKALSIELSSCCL